MAVGEGTRWNSCHPICWRVLNQTRILIQGLTVYFRRMPKLTTICRKRLSRTVARPPIHSKAWAYFLGKSALPASSPWKSNCCQLNIQKYWSQKWRTKDGIWEKNIIYTKNLKTPVTWMSMSLHVNCKQHCWLSWNWFLMAFWS